MDSELFYFCLNRKTNGSNIFCVAGAVVVLVAEVEAGPDNPRFLCTPVETISHAVTVNNINCVVVRVLLRICEYFVDRPEHLGLAVVLVISCVSV